VVSERGPSLSDEQFETWFAAARTGSRSAIGHLLEGCRGYLLSIANRQIDGDLRPKVAPSDLVQDSCLEAQQHFPTFQGQTRAELLAWVRGILLYNISSAHRHYRVTAKRQLSREVSLDDQQTHRAPAISLALDDPSPSEAAVRVEERALFEAALARLPEQYREAITLRHHNQLSFEDIGRQMNRSPEAVRKLWARGIEQLQSLLKNTGD
jgi:RNA polymerase sigma-70 factor (ECF subfamily)